MLIKSEYRPHEVGTLLYRCSEGKFIDVIGNINANESKLAY